MQPKWQTVTDHPLSSQQNVNNNNVLNQTSQTVSFFKNAGEVDQESAESQPAIEDVNEVTQPANETNKSIETDSVGFFDDIKIKSQTILTTFVGMFAKNEKQAQTSTKKLEQEFPISSVSFYS